MVGGVILLTLLAGAADRISAQRALRRSGLTELDCHFSVSATAVWGEPSPRAQIRGTGLDFRIEGIDEARGTAAFAYGAVTTPNTILLAGPVMHFIEAPAEGAMGVASVVITDRSAKRLPATYTRTEYYAYAGPGFASSPAATQYHGTCVATRR
jgi:hypothetical protein